MKTSGLLKLFLMKTSKAGCSDSNNFAFAFDDSNFSDRTLRIQIVPDSADDAKIENRDKEAVALIEETPAGVGLNHIQLGGATESSDPLSSDPSTVLRVKTIHISSPILAAKSPFFYKLFSNGMRESEQQHVTLRIKASEEAALMDLLKFMYSNTSPTTSPPALLELLMAADKFEVASCMRYCSQVLRNIPMTCQSALLYLDLPSSVLMADAVQPLIKAAKQFLAARYKDFTKLYEEEVLNLPLAGIKAVFASDELQIDSEDAVYDFLLKWARIHYPDLEERKEILGSHLVGFIRFPFMTSGKLKQALRCVDLDSKLTYKAVLDAVLFKAETTPHRKCNLAADDWGSAHHPFVQRAYKYRPVKVVEFELPQQQQCVVYLDLKHEECANLFPVGHVYSQTFHFGGQQFYLAAYCNMNQQNLFQCFGLYSGIYMQEKRSVTIAVDYEFAARSKPTYKYVSKSKGNCTLTAGGNVVGTTNVFGVPWTAFMAEDSHYFLNGVLHLRVELTIRQ